MRTANRDHGLPRWNVPWTRSDIGYYGQARQCPGGVPGKFLRPGGTADARAAFDFVCGSPVVGGPVVLATPSVVPAGRICNGGRYSRHGRPWLISIVAARPPASAVRRQWSLSPHWVQKSEKSCPQPGKRRPKPAKNRLETRPKPANMGWPNYLHIVQYVEVTQHAAPSHAARLGTFASRK